MRNKILGLEIDNLTLKEALDEVEKRIAMGGSHHVITANPEILYHAQKDQKAFETIKKRKSSYSRWQRHTFGR